MATRGLARSLLRWRLPRAGVSQVELRVSYVIYILLSSLSLIKSHISFRTFVLLVCNSDLHVDH